MEQKQKAIGVLTSGGDAPGMNAAIRAVTRSALFKKMTVLGIHHGFTGLLARDASPLDLRSVSEILHRGGTVLYTSRCPAFYKEEGIKEGARACRELGLDGLIVIGGDGSFRGAQALSRQGIPCIGIPGTIDNDVACSEYTVGFDTAVNTVIELVDKLRDTSQSHDRCSVVEVMGRHCGDIALYAGIACGALAILVPEMPCSVDAIVEKMQNTLRTGKRHFIIIVAEGVAKEGGFGSVPELAIQIEARTGVETRATVLGYVQRGGTPTARERVLASEMGAHAVEVLEHHGHSRIVAVRHNQIVDLDLEDALSMNKTFNRRLYEIADMISI
jgi:6-phosphofructokinase 1